MNAFLIFAFTLVILHALANFVRSSVEMQLGRIVVPIYLAALAGNATVAFAGWVGLVAAWTGRI